MRGILALFLFIHASYFIIIFSLLEEAVIFFNLNKPHTFLQDTKVKYTLKFGVYIDSVGLDQSVQMQVRQTDFELPPL